MALYHWIQWLHHECGWASRIAWIILWLPLRKWVVSKMVCKKCGLFCIQNEMIEGCESRYARIPVCVLLGWFINSLVILWRRPRASSTIPAMTFCQRDSDHDGEDPMTAESVADGYISASHGSLLLSTRERPYVTCKLQTHLPPAVTEQAVRERHPPSTERSS